MKVFFSIFITLLISIVVISCTPKDDDDESSAKSVVSGNMADSVGDTEKHSTFALFSKYNKYQSDIITPNQEQTVNFIGAVKNTLGSGGEQPAFYQYLIGEQVKVAALVELLKDPENNKDAIIASLEQDSREQANVLGALLIEDFQLDSTAPDILASDIIAQKEVYHNIYKDFVNSIEKTVTVESLEEERIELHQSMVKAVFDENEQIQSSFIAEVEELNQFLTSFKDSIDAAVVKDQQSKDGIAQLVSSPVVIMGVTYATYQLVTVGAMALGLIGYTVYKAGDGNANGSTTDCGGFAIFGDSKGLKECRERIGK